MHMEQWEPRFWSKVNKTETCWLWTGALTPKGYGNFSVGRGTTKRAHWWSYGLANGPLPKGKLVDHRCHVKHCVNPSHLRPVTNKQNLENRVGAASNSKSGVRGVCWYAARNKWLAYVTHHSKRIHVGYFIDLADAEQAVIAKRLELFTHNEVDRLAT